MHGKSTKPLTCLSVDPEFVHREKGRKCRMCGDCCYHAPAIDPTSRRGIAIMQRIRQQSDLLKEVGVDAEKVIELIKRDQRVPLRRYVDAGDIYGEVFLPDSVCALLVPEEAASKVRKKRR